MTEPAKKPPELKKKTLSAQQKRQPNFALGQFGENQAAQFLKNKGYQLLAQNLAYGRTEVDLVALDVKHDELVFVEVKTRSKDNYGSPSQAVNHRKLQAMMRVARAYLKKTNLKKNFRFDIITWVSGKIEHYCNVTWP